MTKILYNPPNGAPIEHFIFNGYKKQPHPVGELRQYSDSEANELLKIFGFLEVKTSQQAQEIVAKPKEYAFKCEYCDYKSDKKIGLVGHMRGHQEEIKKAKEPQIDPDIVPISTGEKVEPNRVPSAAQPSYQASYQDNLTSDSSFYGPGLTESKG